MPRVSKKLYPQPEPLPPNSAVFDILLKQVLEYQNHVFDRFHSASERFSEAEAALVDATKEQAWAKSAMVEVQTALDEATELERTLYAAQGKEADHEQEIAAVLETLFLKNKEKI